MITASPKVGGAPPRPGGISSYLTRRTLGPAPPDDDPLDFPSPSDGAAAALDGPAGSLRSRERGQLAGGRGSGLLSSVVWGSEGWVLTE
eukprot:SAG22_NODE_15147_length_356_cov_0.587549_1_plen_89_part_01